MRVMRKISLLTLMFAMAMFIQTALALPLPTSSFRQGSVSYEETLWQVDFAVYNNHDEFKQGDDYYVPGDGQYIYAYQIFNDDILSESPVSYFGIFGTDGREISESSILGLGSQNDSPDDPSDEGVAPTTQDFDEDTSMVMWDWSNGYIYADEHSWFLAFSSNQAPVTGDFTIGFEEETDLLIPGNPEPATILLLGAGAVMLLKKRKKSKS